MNRHFVGLLLSLVALWLGGCATASKPESMVPLTSPVTPSHDATVQVTVAGGGNTSAAGKSQIASEDIKAALVVSILNSRVFDRVTEPADYRLDLFIVDLDQPNFGFNMTVTLEITWSLNRIEDDKVVWQKSIVSSHTAKAGEAFAGVTRLRLANEGAARENISAGIAALSALDLN